MIPILSNKQISELIVKAMNQQELTLESCCKRFNNRYLDEVKSGTIKPLNKDFLSRVKRNDFKVCSGRISKLCEFLGIDIYKQQTPEKNNLEILNEQIAEFQMYIQKNPDLNHQFNALVSFLSSFSSQTQEISMED